MTRLTPRSRTALRVVGVVALTLILAACAGDAELDTRENLAGPEARTIETFTFWVLILSYIVFSAVMGVTVYAYRNFRIRTDDYEDGDWPEQIHGNDKLEYLWTAIPAIIMALIGITTLWVHNDINSRESNPIAVTLAGGEIMWDPEVVVVGQQWWWEYQYHFNQPEGALDQKRVEELPTADIVTATQMVIPVGQEIELEITSRDVIHSHWIPSLNGKRDAVPGRQSAPWKIEADEPGVYFGQCTEFCGLSHSRMRMQVVALSEADFGEWIAAQTEPVSLAAEDQVYVDALVSGEVVEPANSNQRAINTFRTKCASCHLMDGVADDLWSTETVAENLVSGAAPNLTHFSSRTTFAGGILNIWDPETREFNQNDLREWLANPESVKANYTEPVTEDDTRLRGMPNLGLTTQEIDDLVALLESTGPKPSDFVIEQSGVE